MFSIFWRNILFIQFIQTTGVWPTRRGVGHLSEFSIYIVPNEPPPPSQKFWFDGFYILHQYISAEISSHHLTKEWQNSKFKVWTWVMVDVLTMNCLVNPPGRSLKIKLQIKTCNRLVSWEVVRYSPKDISLINSGVLLLCRQTNLFKYNWKRMKFECN